MTKFFPEYMIDAIPADLTAIDSNGNTYVGRFDRERRRDDTDIKTQPIWMIKKIEVSEFNSEKVYSTTYPNGVKAYNNVWNDHATLTYSFNKN